ncbi:GntR family transcriptional regulator [Deinococcus misasensis]|uniref:GntR family transcriptional regulator n=1 Tax=Deinococcus misasensis TaxID=392413 RepID=UPI00054D6C7A|nr:GntR family transcriptional regulator [Deinococcus misasensis]
MLQLRVDPHSGIPIYLQILSTIKDHIEHGILRQGDTLPTVRQLATEHRIAPNTVMKAYSELQREGIIESRPGVGTVITASSNQRQDLQLQSARQAFQDAALRLKRLGASLPEIHSLLTQTFSEDV